MDDARDGMATVFRSSGFSAEMEAKTIKEILDSNGVPAIIDGMDVLPGAHEILVQVSEQHQEQAERLIAEALSAGPEAAEEGEKEFEQSH